MAYHPDTPSLDTSFHDGEMAVDTASDRAWHRFCAAVEKLLGCSLDGNQDEDGFCLDMAHDAWKAGKSPGAYFATIKRPVALPIGWREVEA